MKNWIRWCINGLKWFIHLWFSLLCLQEDQEGNQKRFIIFGSACWQPVISMTYVANFQGSVWRAKSVRVDLVSGTVPETGVTRASIFLAHSPFNLPTSLLFQSSIRQFSHLPLVAADDVIAGCVCICVCGVSFISFYMRGWWRLFLLLFLWFLFLWTISQNRFERIERMVVKKLWMWEIFR